MLDLSGVPASIVPTSGNKFTAVLALDPNDGAITRRHDGPCMIDAENYEWCAAQPLGGIARCCARRPNVDHAAWQCARCVLVPPATCVPRDVPLIASVTIEAKPPCRYAPHVWTDRNGDVRCSVCDMRAPEAES